MVKVKELNSIKNFVVTGYAGLKLYDELWNKYSLSQIFDSVVPKQSGASNSRIMQNLFFRNLIDANSMTALSEKDEEEYFLRKNASLDRTSYGRNLKKLDDEQRNKILLKFNNNFIKQEDIDEDTLMIYDTTVIEAKGKTYEGTDWVYDSCEEKMVRGYALNKLLLSTKKKLTIIDFNVQNKDKDETISMFKRGRSLFGVNKVVFDAGPDLRSMDFYKKLDREGFLFYTKAVNGWLFNYGKDYTIEELKEKIMPRLKKENVISLEVWKEDMRLRLIFVLNDPRVYLTNDFKTSAKKIVTYYDRRWGIEVSFKEEKQNLGLKKLPTRKLNGIKTHFLLCILAYILSQPIITKTKIANGIKLIKRRLIKVWAMITQKYNKLVLEFDIRYKHIKTFYKLLETLNS